MSRVRRFESPSESGMRVVGFVSEDGTMLDEVVDRFDTLLKLENPKTGATAFGAPLAGTGVSDLTMAEVIALGFTTTEYQWLLRYELEAPAGDFITSEYELNAVLGGQTPSKINGIRAAYQDAPKGLVTTEQFRNGPNNRTRGADQYSRYHALGWVDGRGERVQHVPDRFQARYLFEAYFGGRQVMGPISEEGMLSMNLTSMVVLGFSGDEYRAMYAYEEQTGNFVQSEDQLDEIMGYTADMGLRPPSL